MIIDPRRYREDIEHDWTRPETRTKCRETGKRKKRKEIEGRKKEIPGQDEINLSGTGCIS